MKTYVHLRYLAEFILEWKMFRTNAAERIRIYTSCLVTFSENRAFYELMWKNVVYSETAHMTIQYDACALYAG
jgi:hypothetical protein